MPNIFVLCPTCTNLVDSAMKDAAAIKDVLSRVALNKDFLN